MVHAHTLFLSRLSLSQVAVERLQGAKGATQYAPEAEVRVSASRAGLPRKAPRGPACLYARRELTGLVLATVVRGKLVYSRGQFRREPTGLVIGRGGQPLDDKP